MEGRKEGKRRTWRVRPEPGEGAQVAVGNLILLAKEVELFPADNGSPWKGFKQEVAGEVVK